MRKIWIVILVVCLLAVFCCGCNPSSEDPAASSGSVESSTSTKGPTQTSEEKPTATATKELIASP